MPGAPRMTADEVKRRMQAGEDFVTIDTRNPRAWGESGVKARNAIRVLLEDLESELPRIPKNKSIVTYCTSPNESSSANLAQKLREHEYERVWALQGGFDAWLNAGLPLERKTKAA